MDASELRRHQVHLSAGQRCRQPPKRPKSSAPRVPQACDAPSSINPRKLLQQPHRPGGTQVRGDSLSPDPLHSGAVLNMQTKLRHPGPHVDSCTPETRARCRDLPEARPT